MSNNIPYGYTVYEEDEQGVVVYVDFSRFNEDSPEFIKYKDEVFERGPIEVLPRDYAQHFCCARRYNRINTAPKPVVDKAYIEIEYTEGRVNVKISGKTGTNSYWLANRLTEDLTSDYNHDLSTQRIERD